MHWLKKQIFSAKSFRQLSTALDESGAALLVKNVPGAMTVLVANYVYENLKRPILLVAETLEDAEEYADDLTVLLGENTPCLFPGLPMYHRELTAIELSERAEVLLTLTRHESPLVIAPAAALLDPLPEVNAITENSYTIAKGEVLPRESLVQFLHEAGYKREVLVEGVGQYAVRGSVVDIHPYGSQRAVRLEYFGDDVDDLRSFDPTSQRSTGKIQEITLMAAQVQQQGDSNLFQHLPDDAVIIWADGRGVWSELQAAYEDRTSGNGNGNGKRKTETTADLAELVYEEDEDIPPPDFVDDSEPAYTGKTFKPDLVEQESKRFSQLLLSSSPFKTTAQVDIGAKPQERFAANLPLLAERLGEYHRDGYKSVLLCDNKMAGDRLAQVLIERGCPEEAFTVREGGLRHGFMLPEEKLAVLIDHDIFGRMRRRRRFMKFKNAVPLHDLDALKPGDFVVHVDHGIGRYVGMTKIAVGGVQREVLKIEYKDGVNLFVNLESLSSVQKYSGREGFQPPLSKIGGREWKELKRRTKKSLVSIAEDLIKLQALRKSQSGIAFSPDTPWQREMEASFPYEDTPDQMLASDAVKQDMESRNPMDRLVCGDVGYGKTEVALRGAFKAVADGKQVAVLVPTTILAQQHYRTFRERLKSWPMNVRVISRFQSAKEQKEVIKLLEKGEVDVLIGTHRLLSKDVKFNDLGLLIIDEEHRFGVVQKEKIKSLAANIDILSMSATPIPRTLHMALMGARDLSQIKTPPPGRQPIETDVVPFSDKVIRDAIIYELHRDGQVFFVHNRVQSILQMKDHLQELLPKVRFGVAHGQMDEKDLSRAMVDFMEGRFDVLISTMIIESGLDMPKVNTMIINRADRLGVAQLHQLRGRIGRSSRKAYAYLLVPPRFEMSRLARERLAALTNFSSLGAGFQVAMRDLEIRGAGNLLGREQSGFINSIGFEMYQRLIEEAVTEVQVEQEETRKIEKPKDLKLKLDTDAFFPEDYMSEGGIRLNFYRELSRAKELGRIEEIAQDVQDRFGRFPDAARNLFDLVRVRILGERMGAENIMIKANELEIAYSAESVSREQILEIASRSEDFPIEFNVIGAVTIKLPLSKMEHWRDKMSYVVRYLSKVTNLEEEITV